MSAVTPITPMIGSDCRTEMYSVPDETDMKNTNVARTLNFKRVVLGVANRQLIEKRSGIKTISGKINRINRIDRVENSTVWYATVKNCSPRNAEKI
jgi:hypothetical protein